MLILITRSILNLVQERQEAQEKDLQILKDTILELSKQQKVDRQSIQTLQKVAEDNAWGIGNLKTGNDQIKGDFIAFKALQEAHNETMSEVREKREIIYCIEIGHVL